MPTTEEVGPGPRATLGPLLAEAYTTIGLQCHTAPFSWKMIFECNHQLYEMVMTACTPKEEMEWRARLAAPARSSVDAKDPALFCSLDLEMKSLGTLFGKPGRCASSRVQNARPGC